VVLAALLACGSAPPAQSGISAAQTQQRAVIVVVDGARVDEARDEPVLMPRMHDELAPSGALAQGALNTGVPITVEAHAELLTGRRSPLGTFSPGDFGAWRSDVPTLFEALSQARGLETEQMAAMGNTILLGEAIASRYPGLGHGHGPEFEFVLVGDRMARDGEVLEEARRTLADGDIHLLLVNLHLTDAVAHAGGDYPAQLTAVDGPIATLWGWLESHPTYAGQTTLLVVSDHGRHRWDEADDWWSHGDQCAGCRELLLLALGPGVDAGARPAAPITLADVAITLADRLGVVLPHAEGNIAVELLAEPPQSLDRGTRAGAHAASVSARWSAGPDGRGEVWANATRLSSPDAIHAEAPVIAPGCDVVCWRELVMAPGELEHSEWTGRCAQRGDHQWSELKFPVRAGSPFWAPALACERDGALWLADTSNFEGYTGAAAVRPRLLRRSASGEWSEDVLSGPEVSYPLGVSLALGEPSWIAAAISADESDGRDTRQIALWAVDWPDAAAQGWRALASLPPPEDAGRIESPALLREAEGARLAALSWPLAGGITVVVAAAGADGEGWGGWVAVEPGAEVQGHIPPRWDDARWDGERGLWYARGADPIEICRWTSGPPACLAIDADAILSLEPREGGAWLTRADGWTGAEQWVAAP